jgi:hypothetical protein
LVGMTLWATTVAQLSVSLMRARRLPDLPLCADTEAGWSDSGQDSARFRSSPTAAPGGR